MKLVYIAGPYTGKTPWQVEKNIRRAEDLAASVWARGHVGVCVHTMCRHFVGVAPEDVFIEGDLVLLERCDAMLLVEGWEDSKGTQNEVVWCRDNGMPYFEDLDECIKYMDKLETS